MICKKCGYYILDNKYGTCTICDIRREGRQLLLVIIVSAIVALGFALYAANASAFPSMARLGYTSCSTCHVSPTGGGVLTDYGRGIAEAELSTFSYDGQGELAWGLPVSIPRVLLGGDVRTMSIRRGDVKQDFLMQADLELAHNVTKNLWLVMEGGEFGPDHSVEARRNYVMLQTHDGALIYRLGHFMPAYGLMVDDHTTTARQQLGFGEGQESYNAEVSYHGRYGELFVTQTFGQSLTLEATRSDGYQYRTQDETAEIARGALYLGENTVVGASILRGHGQEQERLAYGFYSVLSPWPWCYSLTEVDYQKYWSATLPEKRETVTFETMGFIPYKGIQLEFTEESLTDEPTTFGANLRLFPTAHFELTGKWKKQEDVNTYLFMGHYYL